MRIESDLSQNTLPDIGVGLRALIQTNASFFNVMEYSSCG